MTSKRLRVSGNQSLGVDLLTVSRENPNHRDVTKCVPRALATYLRFAANVCGGLALTFSLATPVLIGSLGVAVDFANYNRVKASLQAAADAAAVAGAREMQVSKTNTDQVESAALSFAAHRLTGDADATIDDLQSASFEVNAQVLTAKSAVKVDITETWTPFFAHFISTGITPVTVSATARFVGSNNLCVLGLGDTGSSVFLDKNARLTGKDCGVYSNSTSSAGFKMNTGAALSASLNCVAGGADVSSSAKVAPGITTDCPAVSDPLIGRPAPAVGSCDHTNLLLSDEIRTLDPGVYCGGMVLDGGSRISLNPGTYIIKDGPMQASGQTVLTGEGVTFFITGTSPGKIHFTMKTHISLSAPTSGTMAGLLIYEDRTLTTKLKHQITSDDARKLIGTIYIPVGDLIVDAKQPVADQSAYTAIIANQLLLKGGPNLVLNSDYDATSVPVPDGIKAATQVVLTD